MGEKGTIRAGACVFLVADVVASAEYYRDALGFGFDRFWGDPPGFCMVWRDRQCVMLARAPDPAAIRPVSSVHPPVWDAYFWVDDADALHAELRGRGAVLACEPFDKPYGVREFVARDPDGHQLAFGQVLDDADGPAPDVELRREAPGDAPDVREVHERAFEQPDEADLVGALRRAGAGTLSLVAIADGRVVGHVLFSPIELDPPARDVSVLGLAPLAVLPEHQRSGIGTRLVQRALEVLRREGHDALVVLGHAHYYPRFGFRPASAFGIATSFEVPDDHFMALELREGALDGVRGTARYHEEFDAFG